MKHTSVWYDLVDVTAHAVPDPLPTEIPVAVIGGGIAGAATLYHLTQRGVRAVLIEQEHLAAGATGRNAGFLISGTVEYFDAAVARWGKADAAAIWAFTLENNLGIRNAIARDRIDCSFQEEGQTICAASEDEWHHIQQSVRLMKELGMETQLLSGTGVETVTGLGGFIGGRFQSDDAILNPAALVLGLAGAAVRDGAQVATGDRVESITPAAEGWTIQTATQECWAGHVVICANAWIRELWPEYSGLVTPVRAQALATAPVPMGLLRGALSSNFGYEYWRQLPNGQVLMGGKRWTEPGQGMDTTELVVQEATQQALHGFLLQHYPQLAEVPITHSWTGLMAFSRDGLPLIGRLPGVEHGYIAGGFTGHGMAFGYLAGKAIADLILETGTALDIGRFDPSRFGSLAASTL